MMPELLKRAMVELRGICSRNCRSCLPSELKTGCSMSFEQAMNMGMQFREAGIKDVVLAGFGDSVSHPDFDDILFGLTNKMGIDVTVTCRVDQFSKVYRMSKVIFSIGSLEDAENLRSLASRTLRFCPQIYAHVLLGSGISKDLSRIVHLLQAIPKFKSVNVGFHLKLCSDRQHVREIKSINKDFESEIKRAREIVKKTPGVVMWDKERFSSQCPFRFGMLYIGADFKLRPCCHQPLAEPLGEINEKTLKEILESEKYQNWLQNPWGPCKRCPDTGGKTTESP